MQELERGNPTIRARAAAALSGMHLLRQDLVAAASCADRALCIDPGNAQALLNKVCQQQLS